MAALTEAQLKLVTDLEMEMMADMYNRMKFDPVHARLFGDKKMSTTCQQKCITPRYNDADLTKAETVCIDRCVAKYMELHDRIGKKLTTLSQQDEERMKQLQAQMQSSGK